MRKLIDNQDQSLTRRDRNDRQPGTRLLTLRRETLRELSAPELDAAAGGRMPSSRTTFI